MNQYWLGGETESTAVQFLYVCLASKGAVQINNASGTTNVDKVCSRQQEAELVFAMC